MFKLNQSALPRLLVAVLFVLFIGACDTLIPPIFTPEPDPPPPEPQSCSTTNNELELAEASPEEQIMACLIINYPEQKRTEMHYDPILGKIARMRAEDMAKNGFYDGSYGYPIHVDRNGFGPNHYLCVEGYRPDIFCSGNPFDNSVESAGMGGGQTPERQFLSWLDSPPHRVHVLGEAGFDASNYYGIGHATLLEDDPLNEGLMISTDFWIFIAAPPP